jgi:hypothetical protein
MRDKIKNRQNIVSPLTIPSFLMVGLLVVIWFVSKPGHALPVVQASAKTAETESKEEAVGFAIRPSAMISIYLPFAVRSFPPPPPTVGVQVVSNINSQNLPLAVAAGVYWLRFDVFRWDEIEPVRTNPPTYHWETVDEASLRNAAAGGLQVIAAIKSTPSWAQKVPGSFCGPVKEDSLDEFAQFVAALVRRYSAPPYNVRYWELGNEPDIDPSLVAPDSVFGCWGDEAQPYYGGGYYATMLKAVYPAIKAVDPRAQVLIGGLLLNCDPTHPPQGQDCKPSKFLEGILRNGGGDYFDIVSFHGYPQYNGSLQLDEHFASWEYRGGVVLGKIDFLQSVLATYGLKKPLFHTEGSLLCPEFDSRCNPPTSAFYEAQADYVVWLYVRNWAEGLMGTIWYQFEGPGWRYNSLLDANQNPKPAYRALTFLTTELANAYYRQPVSQYPDLRAYEFGAPGKRIWVLWAADEQSHTIDLPVGTLRVYDKYGADITPAGSTMSVSSPVYVELSP